MTATTATETLGGLTITATIIETMDDWNIVRIDGTGPAKTWTEYSVQRGPLRPQNVNVFNTIDAARADAQARNSGTVPDRRTAAERAAWRSGSGHGVNGQIWDNA